ncbi:MAG: hypothetical protein HQL28_01115 [Candidatus Omnitrophica bacterium]|nr:hypothetical protein [Candidatus Omnitrophota bacterium]
MGNNILKNKVLLILVAAALALAVSSRDVYAWGGHGGHGGGHGDRYYWHGGRWHNSSWFWFDVGITALAVGAIAASLPPYYTTVYVGGVPYYYYDGIYYRPCPAGYVVVPAPAPVPAALVEPMPVVIQQTQPAAPQESVNAAQPAAQGESFTVNVPNYKGGYTPITLTRSGSGFTGPQGEYYAEFPKIKQLKEMYGR